jgi:hypothetical protein
MILLFFQNVVAAVLDATANLFRLSARVRHAALPRRARTATLPARERFI